MTITTTAARSDITEKLADLSRFAQRQQRIIERYNGDTPTAWTVAHHKINNLLDELDRAAG